jgi:hypothetical protein
MYIIYKYLLIKYVRSSLAFIDKQFKSITYGNDDLSEIVFYVCRMKFLYSVEEGDWRTVC